MSADYTTVKGEGCEACGKSLSLFVGIIAGRMYCFACWIVRA